MATVTSPTCGLRVALLSPVLFLIAVVVTVSVQDIGQPDAAAPGPVRATSAILNALVLPNPDLSSPIGVQQISVRHVMVGFFQVNTAWDEVVAYFTVITIPVLAIHLILHRAFIASIASTGVKG